MRHFPLGHFRLVKEEIDDLIFVKRRAKLSSGHRLLLDIFHKALAVFFAILLRSLLDQRIHFLACHFDIVCLTNLGQKQTKTHASHRNILILVLVVFDTFQRSFWILFIGGFLLKLRPDLFELRIHHAFWNIKIMASGKLIKQRSLHLRAGQASGLLFQLTAQQFFQLVEAFKAQIGRKFIVDLRFGFDLYGFHRDIELGFFSSEMIGLIILREGDLDGFFIASFGAGQLLFKTGNKCA